MTKKYDREFEITDDNGFCVGNTHLAINSEKVTLDGKPISEWLELIVNIQSTNAALAGKVAQLETELATKRGYSEENKIKTENKFAIMEQTPGRITITLKQPNTIKKPKVRAQNITALDNKGLFIKPSGSISDAKLMIGGKPLAEIIDDLREAIKSIGVQLVALQASEAADRACHYKNSGEDYDEYK